MNPPMTRRMLIQRGSLAAGAITAGGLLAACGTSSSSSKVTSGEAVAGGGKAVDKVTWGLPAEPVSMDPAYTYDFETGAVVTNLVDSLMRFTAKGELEPSLAENVTVPNDDVLIYDLRSGVRFHDGTEMNAADAVASLKRHLDPAVGSYFAGVFENVAAIKQTGPMQVTIEFAEPDFALPYMMATMAGAVLPKHFIEKAGSNLGKPRVGVIGTGAYQFGSWASGSQVVIERFPGYWNKSVPRKVRQGVYTVIGDTQTMLAALQSGEIDGTFRVTGRDAVTVKGFENVNVLTAPGLGYDGVGFNQRQPGSPFGSAQARQALVPVGPNHLARCWRINATANLPKSTKRSSPVVLNSQRKEL